MPNLIESDTAPVCRPGDIWKKPTGEYRKFTGGGWVTPTDTDFNEVGLNRSSPVADPIPELIEDAPVKTDREGAEQSEHDAINDEAAKRLILESQKPIDADEAALLLKKHGAPTE